MEKVDKWNLRKVGEKMMFQLIKDFGPEEQEKEVEKMLGALNLIRIEPTRMVLRKYTPEFTMPKYEWKEE
jgi:hypothetical protein